jgi:hypothetical protein
MKRISLASFAALAVALGFAGCKCGGDPGSTDGGRDGNVNTACVELGAACATSQECCSGRICNANNVCSDHFVPCTQTGGTCANNNDCCGASCNNGVCGAQCVDLGGTCSSASDCCTDTCVNGTCAPIPGSSATCSVIGGTCTVNEECCSKNCQGGTCVPQWTCKATDELCYGDQQCCSKLCSKNDNTAGYCILRSGRCNQDGMPCEGGSNCCTRICLDPGSGTKICQPASGCIMTGMNCIDADACCGGGSNPNGTVKCEREQTTYTYGRCDNGQSCNPVGNICGAAFPGVLPDGGAVDVNASQNCCDGKKEVCKRDRAGIPRCFGGCPNNNCDPLCPTGYTGVDPCCIQIGELCQFSDQCCNGAPCVPGSDGKLRCSASNCVPLGSTCTIGGTACCSGQCIGDEFGTVCRIPTDAGSCKSNGTACSSPAECCSLACINGTCQTPDICQGVGQVCTNAGDCCTGLACVTPSDGGAATCQSSSCAGAGQSCSSANSCCQGLSCMQAGTISAPCNDSTACTCTSPIG